MCAVRYPFICCSLSSLEGYVVRDIGDGLPKNCFDALRIDRSNLHLILISCYRCDSSSCCQLAYQIVKFHIPFGL